MDEYVTPYSHSPLLAFTDSFNWSLSDAVNISTISVSNQSSEFHRFLKNFIRAKSLYPATAEQYWHLIQNLQCTIQSYNDYVVSLQSKIQQLQKTIKKLKKNQTSENVVERYLCPVCLDAQVTLVDLDDHISKQHKDIADKWNSLRYEKLRNYPIESQNLNQNNISINELHHWMINKFDYLEEMISAKKRERKHHRYHRNYHSNNSSFHYQNSENNRPMTNNLNNQNEIAKTNPIDASPFHKNDKKIFNLSETHFPKIEADVLNKSFIQSSENYNVSLSNQDSDKYLTNHIFNENRSDDLNKGYFVEEIENNNNHSIFNVSTTSARKLRSKSQDLYS